MGLKDLFRKKDKKNEIKSTIGGADNNLKMSSNFRVGESNDIGASNFHVPTELGESRVKSTMGQSNVGANNNGFYVPQDFDEQKDAQFTVSDSQNGFYVPTLDDELTEENLDEVTTYMTKEEQLTLEIAKLQTEFERPGITNEERARIQGKIDALIAMNKEHNK